MSALPEKTVVLKDLPIWTKDELNSDVLGDLVLR